MVGGYLPAFVPKAIFILKVFLSHRNKRGKMIHVVEPQFGLEEKEAVIDYFESGGWLTEHTKTREFEKALAGYLGIKHCIALSNGTVTLFAALAACGIGVGDEVIVPDYTFIATATAVSLTGATPVFVDISLSNLCLDLDLAEQAITPRTKAIILVSLNGRAPNMWILNGICRRNNLYLIEDAAQSLGSKYERRFLGTFGHVGSFSFSAMKIISTGQGGAVVTDDDEVADRIRKIKNFGRPSPGANYHETIGYNFKWSDLQAVIGMEQLKKLPYRVSHKKGMFDLYRELLEDIEEITFTDTDLKNITPWVVDILVPDPVALHDYLKSRGIGTRFAYPAIHSQPAYANPVNHDYYFPNSAYVAKHGLWLPSSSNLIGLQIEWICEEVRRFYCKSQ